MPGFGEIKAVVTDENVDDMMDAAGYGTTYWAASPRPEDHSPDAAFTIVLSAEESDSGEREVYHLGRDDVRVAYGKLLDLDQQYVNRTIHGYFIDSWRERDEDGIDAGYIDSNAADVLVQVACFDQVVYG